MTALFIFIYEAFRRASVLLSKAGPVAMVALVLSMFVNLTSTFDLMDVLTEPLFEALLNFKGKINSFLASYADDQSFNVFGYCFSLDVLAECFVLLFQLTIGWALNLFLFFGRLFLAFCMSISVAMGWRYFRKLLFP